MTALTNGAVLNALAILDLLGRAPAPLRLKEIARELNLAESTTHRLLASLLEKGYVRQREPHGSYALGWKIVTLARSLSTEPRLVQDLHPYLERVLREVGQTVNLGVLAGTQVTYLDCLVPNDVMSLYTPPGMLCPAHATALGKVLLAYLPAPDQEATLDRLTLQPLTPRTITSRAALGGALADVRRRGYAVDHGELHGGVHCVAVPVLDPTGQAPAAISVTARAADLPEQWEERTVRALATSAEEAGRHLFAGVPGP